MQRLTPRDTGFQVYMARNAPSFRMAPHAHEEHELNVVISGAGRYLCGDGAQVGIGAGQIVLLPGGSMHQLRVDETMRMAIILLHPSMFDSVTSKLPDAQESFAWVSSLKVLSFIQPSIYQNLLELCGQFLGGAYRANDTIGMEACHCIARLVVLSTLALPRLADGDTQLDHSSRRVLTVKAWIDRNYAEHVSLEDLAGMAHLSTSQFSSIFRKVTGCPPKHYLNERRLSSAESLLAQTGVSILEIALSVGYCHVAHFNRSFKERSGLTPSDYRKKHQEIH